METKPTTLSPAYPPFIHALPPSGGTDRRFLHPVKARHRTAARRDRTGPLRTGWRGHSAARIHRFTTQFCRRTVRFCRVTAPIYPLTATTLAVAKLGKHQPKALKVR